MDDQMPHHEDSVAAGPPEQYYMDEMYGGVQHEESVPQVSYSSKFVSLFYV